MNNRILALAGAGLLAASAHAHVTLEYQVAPAAASYKATFKVGHGCGDSPTTQLVVQVPAQMRNAHPMPTPGWTITLQRQGDAVSRITWAAKTPGDALPGTHYDEFVIVARTPEQGGPVYWPVSQVCESGRHDWTEIPQPGQKLSELKSPAAYLEVLPADAAGASAHHH
jgi:uncharacterized protein YcnI